MNFTTLSSYMGDGLINYTFGSPLIAGAVLIIFILALEWKMGVSSDVMMASLPILFIGLGASILAGSGVEGYFAGAVALIIGILLGVAVWKMLGK